MASGLDSGAPARGVVFSVPFDGSKNNPISAWLSNISCAERADMCRQICCANGGDFWSYHGEQRGAHRAVGRGDLGRGLSLDCLWTWIGLTVLHG